MTDDIVTRLRQMQNMQPIREENIVNPRDAADEIERLRADIENVRDMNERLTQELQSYYEEDEEIRRGRSGE